MGCDGIEGSSSFQDIPFDVKWYVVPFETSDVGTESLSVVHLCSSFSVLMSEFMIGYFFGDKLSELCLLYIWYYRIGIVVTVVAIFVKRDYFASLCQYLNVAGQDFQFSLCRLVLANLDNVKVSDKFLPIQLYLCVHFYANSLSSFKNSNQVFQTH